MERYYSRGQRIVHYLKTVPWHRLLQRAWPQRKPQIRAQQTALPPVWHSVFDHLIPSWEQSNINNDLAREIQSNAFPILGCAQIAWPNHKDTIDWNWDPINQRSLQPPYTEGDDLKYPMELSRMQFLIPFLAYGHQQGEFKRYAQHSMQLLRAWHANTQANDLAWYTSMDVSIRLITLLFIHELFAHNQYDTAAQHWLQSRIIEHQDFVHQQPEYNGGLNGNHYLVNLCALACAHHAQFGTSSAALAKKIEAALDRQFNEAGWFFEASTHYHLLATQCLVLFKHLGYATPPLEQAIEICNYLQHDQHYPSFGDNDAGVLWHVNYHKRGQAYYPSSFDLLPSGKKTTSISDAQPLPFTDWQFSSKKKFEVEGPWQFWSSADMGIHTWYTTDSQLWLFCPSGAQKENHAHTHANFGSIALMHRGKWLAHPAGTYNYNRDLELRHYFRSNRAQQLPYSHAHQQLALGRSWKQRFEAIPLLKNTKVEANAAGAVVSWSTDRSNNQRRIEIQPQAIVVHDGSNLPFQIDWDLPLTSPVYGQLNRR